jgi:hypothetical protein
MGYSVVFQCMCTIDSVQIMEIVIPITTDIDYFLVSGALKILSSS